MFDALYDMMFTEGLNGYIQTFFIKNWIALVVIFGYYVLQDVAKRTPWVADDKIVELLTGAVSRFKKNKTGS